ncbi:hypothetical protein O6R08_09250 [Cutibacterium equinum]|uniref:Uncharacterized protein n=1 Tax=Cutibacterium equinum TaxID=3016342 RepID=A0ABY7R335_9ACTN|nr:hypothetical protein [Cutibacterium equinum]WCC81167.1 hypothetical protein O6R08_09250 [Cutibacterium equinum]
MPTAIVLARVVVIGISALWILFVCVMWGWRRNAPDGPMDSFTLGLESGTWAQYLLIPLAGCVLTVTMGRGHAIDRYLFTAVSLLWMWTLARGNEFASNPDVFGVMMVMGVLVTVWSGPVNTWIKAIAERDKAIANPPEGGWLEPGQTQPWQTAAR